VGDSEESCEDSRQLLAARRIKTQFHPEPELGSWFLLARSLLPSRRTPRSLAALGMTIRCAELTVGHKR
jgi:hypothetical protein